VYFTHHFAHHDTLSRAHSWLTRLGFHPQQLDDDTSGIPRIVMAIEPQLLDAVKLLINAFELTDPDGFPSFWEEARQPHSAPKGHHEGIPAERPKPHHSVIGWHPLD